MISDALEFIRQELRLHLGVADSEVILNSVRTLADKDAPPGAYISVVNVEEESNLRNQANAPRHGNVSRFAGPPQLNVDVLFAFGFQTYSASLMHLSKTIDLFQLRPVFARSTQADPETVPFPEALEKLVFEMVNLNFEQLSQLWGAIGSAYFPSVVYRVRLPKVSANAVETAPELTTIQLDAALQ